jgi:hypothetical protein
VRVKRGHILSYRLFDVADEIRLDLAESLAKDWPRRRIALAVDAQQSMMFATSPLVITLGKRKLELPRADTNIEAEVTARLFDYGAISVLFELTLAPGTDLATLVPLCEELYMSAILEVEARREVEAVLRAVAPAIDRAHNWPGAETYTVTFVQELEQPITATEAAAWPPMPRLLLGEESPRKLSAKEVSSVLKHAYSYFDDDLAIVDWNSAFVLEPSGSRAIPDILEFATSQLLELRYYDGVFDVELARIYDHLSKAKESPFTLFSAPYAKLGREVLLRLVELTEFTERVDNALKIIGDPYLANVYMGAIQRFRIPQWRAAVDEKQRLVAQAYDLIKGELETRRGTIMEVIVILLITFELIAALRGH